MWVLVSAPFGPVTIRAPVESMVDGWQVAQSNSRIVGWWLGSAGGMPWQVPHAACPLCVHKGVRSRFGL
jgi:hypothetical protein